MKADKYNFLNEIFAKGKMSYNSCDSLYLVRNA